MSRTGDCYDNAVAESFCASLKTEWVDGKGYSTRAEAPVSIADYIERSTIRSDGIPTWATIRGHRLADGAHGRVPNSCTRR
jgi:integrase-like protein